MAKEFMQYYHRLVSYAIEHWPDYTPSPSGEGTAYLPYYNSDHGRWFVGAYTAERSPWVPYGPKDKVEELVVKLNSGEVEL